MEQPDKRLPASPLVQALQCGALVLGAATGPRWRSLLAVPESVAQARRFAEGVLAEVAESDVDHVDDVVLVVSELITNAVREVVRANRVQAGARPVHLGIAARPRWTHISAVDTAPALPKETGHGPLPISGRGIPIIRALAALTWVECGRSSKTIHAVVARTGVELTPDEEQAFRL